MTTCMLCPQCKLIYGAKAVHCERCGEALVPLDDPDQLFTPIGAIGETGHFRATYLLAALAPALGLILALVSFARRDRQTAKGLLLTALAAGALGAAILALCLR